MSQKTVLGRRMTRILLRMVSLQGHTCSHKNWNSQNGMVEEETSAGLAQDGSVQGHTRSLNVGLLRWLGTGIKRKSGSPTLGSGPWSRCPGSVVSRGVGAPLQFWLHVRCLMVFENFYILCVLCNFSVKSGRNRITITNGKNPFRHFITRL